MLLQNRCKTFILPILIFLLLLTGCNSTDSKKNESIPSPVESSTTTESTFSKPVLKNDDALLNKYDVNKDGDISVVFIGNSYTNSGSLVFKFKKIADSQQVYLKITSLAHDSYTLLKHSTELAIDHPDVLPKADIVILQDYGGYMAGNFEDIANRFAGTSIVVPRIQSLFGENTLFYFYPYCVASEVYNEELELYENLQFVDTGDIFYKITEDFNVDYFIANYHNNDLCSYIFASAIFCEIFDADCTDFPYEKIIGKSLLPGTTLEEKEKNLAIFKKTIMEYVNNT